MCGLVGMAGALTTGHRSMMKDLLYFDTLRGKDSTGVLSVNRQKQYEIRKLAMPGYDFIQMHFIDNLFSHNDSVWLGHNRFKTMGDVNRMNAHPFGVYNDADELVLAGAHNGTLKNKWEIEKELDGERFGTDSEALYNLIGKDGLKDAMAKVEGAWALTYWDGPDHTINFLRNKERPLYYAFLEDRKVLVWASEMWMIRVASMRNNYKLEEDAVFMTAEDTHYVIEIPKSSTDKFGDFIREGGVRGKPERNFQSHAWFGGGYRYEPAKDDKLDDELPEAFKATKETSTSGGTKSEESAEGKRILTIVGGTETIKTGFEGEPLTQKQYDEIVATGCAWCRKKLNKGVPVGFLDSKACVCLSCMRGSDDIAKQSTLESNVNNIVKQAQERMKG